MIIAKGIYAMSSATQFKVSTESESNRLVLLTNKKLSYRYKNRAFSCTYFVSS